MECTRWRKNQQAYLEVIWKENKTDDVICLHFGVYGNTCGHMIPSSDFDTRPYATEAQAADKPIPWMYYLPEVFCVYIRAATLENQQSA